MKSILKQFDKAVAKLEELADRNRTEAGLRPPKPTPWMSRQAGSWTKPTPPPRQRID
ncbi:hypothetical protein D16iCDA_02060 [Pseudomonas seleniipraecipitans]|uniref:Uncharacterized protein n=1 Tax=Phytopseudomonas seleniipraecipitans TaxID=640205 RepID=A0ABY5JB14_9GAMM|nr:hypothetical protein [Pseudomonas seleniipraecipitans]UUD64513.1 hypothetical protein D16iCDA_02060 [Pseudomonas seleniipraecipitans]